MGELDGRVAVISGGTRGIGRAIAEAYLRDGAKVVVSGRDVAKGQQAIAEMNAGDNALFVQSDATKKEDCERLITEAVAKYGRVDRWRLESSLSPPRGSDGRGRAFRQSLF